MHWAEKHAPKALAGLAGNPSAAQDIASWASSWKRGSRPLLLVGPSGTGKTAAALALAGTMGWELLEMNASDVRGKEEVARVAGLASVSSTFSGRRRLILLDEIDGLFRADSGGATAVLAVLRGSEAPVILTANDEYAKPLASIRKECAVVKFKRIHASTVANVLASICAAEGVGCDPEALALIAKANNGDLKASINDLQAFAIGRERLEAADVAASSRDRADSIFNAMRAVFKTMTYSHSTEAFDSANEDPNLFMKWVDENIPREYTDPEDLANAFGALARADFYAAAIMSRQQWQLMKFEIAMMTAGVSLAKKGTYHTFTAYQFPSFISKLSATKAGRGARQSAAAKIGKKIHASPREVITEHWPYFQLLAKADPEGYAKGFSLEEKELVALGIGASAAKRLAVKEEASRG